MKQKSRFEKSVSLPLPRETVYGWHEEPLALKRLTPPWVCAEFIQVPSIKKGAVMHIKLRKGPFSTHWKSKITEAEAPKKFVDEQIKGPFSYWKHTHLFEERRENETVAKDQIDYRAPAIFNVWIKKSLERAFTFRHLRLANDMRILKKYGGQKKLRFLISGATGFIGSNLKIFLECLGHEVYSLTRHPRGKEREVKWDGKSQVDEKALEGMDAAIHLAGENIGAFRWTEEKKRRILESRVLSTKLLVDAFNRIGSPPPIFICASAVGYYGNSYLDWVTEECERGRGFLADVCAQWEKEARAYRKGRAVQARFGTVLGMEGGMLKKALLPFQLGLGGKIGSGDQWMSWIALDDLIYGLYHSVMTPSLSGAVNFTAPHPVTNLEFTKALAKVLKRWAPFPLPAMAVKKIFGEMGEALLLASVKARPEALLESGMEFAFPKIEKALRFSLGAF